MKNPTDKKIAANALLSYGRYQTIHANAGVNGTLEKLGYNVQYTYLKSKGFSSAYDSIGNKNFDKDGFEQNNIRADLKYRFTKALSAKAFGNFNAYNNSLDAGAFTDDKDYTAKNKNNLAGLAFKYTGGSISWNLSGSYEKADRSFVNDSTDITSPYSKEAMLDAPLRLKALAMVPSANMALSLEVFSTSIKTVINPILVSAALVHTNQPWAKTVLQQISYRHMHLYCLPI